MRYKILGNSGLRVSELCLGTMTFGEEFQWGSSFDESRKVFETFIEAGGNFIDTANIYTRGTSENCIGEWVKGRRESLVLATKYSFSTNPDDPNAGGNHRKNMVHSVEKSLQRLQTDCIDLYWVHAWDGTTPIDEVMRALDDLVRAGKIMHFGLSDTPAWVVARGNALAELLGRSSCVAVQLEYSLVERSIEGEYFSLLDAHNLTLNAWSPLGMGLLTGKYTTGKAAAGTRFSINDYFEETYLTKRNLEIAKAVDAVAEELSAQSSQVALRWMMQKRGDIIPIIGAKNSDQLMQNIGALKLELSSEQMERLDAVSQMPLPFPHSFLNRDGIRKMLVGDNIFL